MIARLDAGEAAAGAYRHFLEALADDGLEGEIAPDHADRTVLATDNALYRRRPRDPLQAQLEAPRRATPSRPHPDPVNQTPKEA
ncbi:hypothetical protein [Halomonas maura]|uniref:hypothetical protein n=1 Tax=Halomonas maura TaxID=117606 RepID=UPI0025B5B79F|nr:hypothetical protein [Halomonas maura]MDN3557827.1 hypothetical protein [Halomonas maura]